MGYIAHPLLFVDIYGTHRSNAPAPPPPIHYYIPFGSLPWHHSGPQCSGTWEGPDPVSVDLRGARCTHRRHLTLNQASCTEQNCFCYGSCTDDSGERVTTLVDMGDTYCSVLNSQGSCPNSSWSECRRVRKTTYTW